MLTLAWSLLRYHQHVRPGTPNSTQPWLPSDPFWGGELWFCGFSVSFSSRKGKEKRSKERQLSKKRAIPQNEARGFQPLGGTPFLLALCFQVWA